MRPRSYREPALAELGHPDVAMGDTAFLTIRRAMPALAELGPPDVASGRDSYYALYVLR